jgi:hypothetical protein
MAHPVFVGGGFPAGREKEFSMRKLLMGVLMAATAATPVLAQDGNWRGRYERQAERNAERSERQESRGETRQERQQARAERQQVQVQQQQVQIQQQQVQAQQQQVERQQYQGQRGSRGNWQGQSRGNWQGGDQSAEREAMQRQIEASREASRASQQGLSGRYRQQAERNQQGYERQVRQDYRQGQRGGDWRRGGQDNRGGWSNGDRNGSRSSWNRGWRNDNRYDWQRYRSSNRNLFHSGRYYSPYRNYNYNRLSIGLFLDSLFYSQNYWIGDPWQYRLPAAPYGTQWVRYYDDVVLVDVYTGEVLDVIYDFFW